MSYITPEGRDIEAALSFWPLESALLGPPQSSNLFPSPQDTPIMTYFQLGSQKQLTPKQKPWKAKRVPQTC